MNTEARHSHDSAEWYTPSLVVEAARTLMGGIDLDPASHEEANRTVKATRYFTEADNGLLRPWTGRVFVNPPGGLVPEFWRKWLYEDFTEGVWVGFSVEQLQTLQCTTFSPIMYPMCIPRRRIAFIENEAMKVKRIAKLLAKGKKPNEKSQPSHANYIVYRGSQPQRFLEVFSQLGHCRRPLD
jgi:hypothetical protein